jgi:Tfp pilus assembly protein PilZ
VTRPLTRRASGGLAAATATCLLAGACAHVPRPRTGDISFRLEWAGEADLDLHVIEPDGFHLEFRRRESPSGGALDIDCNGRPDRICADPIENVYWPVGRAPSGRYVAWVELFNTDVVLASIDYTLRVFLGDRPVEEHRGAVSPSRPASRPLARDFRRGPPAPAPRKSKRGIVRGVRARRRRGRVYRRQRSGFDRVPYVGVCDVAQDGAHERGLLCNLSILGAYVHTERPPARHSEIEVAFDLPDGGPQVRAAGSVAWVNDGPLVDSTALPHGFGVHFLEANPDDIRRIATLVSSFLDVPEPEYQFGVGIPRSGKARIPFVAPCAITIDSRTYSGTICNLSTLGLFVALDEAPVVGERGRVRFGVAGLADSMEVDAVVAWVNERETRKMVALPPGCGLRFDRMTLIDEVVLHTVVDRYVDTIAAERAPAG